jgi:hypothetical protein
VATLLAWSSAFIEKRTNHPQKSFFAREFVLSCSLTMIINGEILPRIRE